MQRVERGLGAASVGGSASTCRRSCFKCLGGHTPALERGRPPDAVNWFAVAESDAVSSRQLGHQWLCTAPRVPRRFVTHALFGSPKLLASIPRDKRWLFSSRLDLGGLLGVFALDGDNFSRLLSSLPEWLSTSVGLFVTVKASGVRNLFGKRAAAGAGGGAADRSTDGGGGGTGAGMVLPPALVQLANDGRHGWTFANDVHDGADMVLVVAVGRLYEALDSRARIWFVTGDKGLSFSTRSSLTNSDRVRYCNPHWQAELEDLMRTLRSMVVWTPPRGRDGAASRTSAGAAGVAGAAGAAGQTSVARLGFPTVGPLATAAAAAAARSAAARRKRAVSFNEPDQLEQATIDFERRQRQHKSSAIKFYETMLWRH